MAENRKPKSNGLFNGGFYFYFGGGQWRYYYVSGLTPHGNPLSAPPALYASGEV